MSNIDKRALRVLATALDGDDWHAEGNSVYGGRYDVGDNVCYDHIASCESVNGKSPHADFIAAANPATVLALLDELEAKGQMIAELEAKLETADKLQDSSFRHGLQHGFSYGQTDDQAGFEQAIQAYGQQWKGE